MATGATAEVQDRLRGTHAVVPEGGFNEVHVTLVVHEALVDPIVVPGPWVIDVAHGGANRAGPQGLF